MNTVHERTPGILECDCGATCRNVSKESKRFLSRHPAKCSARQAFAKEMAEGTRSVDADAPQVVNGTWVGDESAKPKDWADDKPSGHGRRVGFSKEQMI